MNPAQEGFIPAQRLLHSGMSPPEVPVCHMHVLMLPILNLLSL